MPTRHPELDLYLAAERGEVPWREVRRLCRRHLDALCEDCELGTSVFEAFLRDDLRSDPAARQRCYADVADGTLDLATAFALDRATVDRELEELRGLPPQRLVTRIRRAAWPRFRSPLLAEALIQEARSRLHLDEQETLAVLAGARAVVARAEADLQGGRGHASLRDLRIRIRAHEGNARRVRGNLRAAERIFVEIRKGLAGAEPPAIAVSAELASFEASLRYGQRRLAEADKLLERAAKFYRWADDRNGLAKVLVQRGMVLYMSGDPLAAARCYGDALPALGDDSDPRTALSAYHNLVLCLCDLDRSAEAHEMLRRARDLYLRVGDPTTINLLAWAEGKVASGLGDDEAALTHLRAARGSYTQHLLPLDAALVALDLAALHLRRGETAEVKRLAEEMLPAFASRGVDREAARAVAIFAQAALSEALTAEAIGRTRTALLRAKGRPAHQA